MRFTVIGPTHPFRGGISHYTFLLVRTLRSRHQIQFVSYCRQYPAWLYPGNNDRDPSRDLRILEQPDYRFDALNPLAWGRLPRRVLAHTPELIILPWSTVYWSPFYYIFLKSLGKRAAISVVFLCHNVLEHEGTGLKSRISRGVLVLGDRFVVHSLRDEANLLEWIGSQRRGDIRVSPHPVYEHLRTALHDKRSARARFGLTAERVLLFFGFIREYKGLRFLLRSLPLIHQHFPVHLLIAGEAWEDRRVYQELIRELRLEQSVTLNSQYIPNEEVATYFAASDLVVVPYVSATQSGIVQLAFGFRKPVVVGAVGGLPEVVEHKKTGYLVPPCSPQAIAEAVLDFYGANRESDMIENIEKILPRFSWQKMMETIEGLAGSCAASPMEHAQDVRK